MRTVLTIAGSDSCGGAGIQADLRTMNANGVYGMSAITALTAQNPAGIRAVMEVSPDFLGQQIDAVCEYRLPDAVKIGMVPSAALLEVIADRLSYDRISRVVIDPVMIATSGTRLIAEDAVSVLQHRLFPLASVITPNIPEAEVLSGMHIRTKDNMEQAAAMLGEIWGCAVLLKGGHSLHDADDLLYADGTRRWFCGTRIDTPDTHGTGCTLSSAIAAHLARGCSLEQAVERAKAYITDVLTGKS